MEKELSLADVLAGLPVYNSDAVDELLRQELKQSKRKIVVLDDDPTGVQTVHGVYVYTDWMQQSIDEAFSQKENLFFILTNSRGFTAAITSQEHKHIAERIGKAAEKTGSEYILISRSDSTLRGHYPLETQMLREGMESNNRAGIDGEIICPFFLEGGRYTIEDIHYVADGDRLIPAGQTEFAADKTFGYRSSNLREWVEEKTNGEYGAASVTSITLSELRRQDYDAIVRKLTSVARFNKIIVNAVSYEDIKVFVTAFLRAIRDGKSFIFRSAAAIPKVLGGISDKPCLSRHEMINLDNRNGGIVIVGSHVQKTTRQLEVLKRERQDDGIEFIEFNQHLVLDDIAFEAESQRVVSESERVISSGRSAVVYTRRDRFDLNTGNKEDELRIAIKISDSLTGIITGLKSRPNYIIAKGGITSSDIGTKGLGVKKALVLGQILKGIPVWLTGGESKFADMPYVIFPGNVGDENALLDAVNILQPPKGND